MPTPPMFKWLYLANGKVTHAHKIDPMYRPVIAAECGVSTYTWWYGTGRQSEYEKAESLPKCARCVKLVAQSESGRRKPHRV